VTVATVHEWGHECTNGVGGEWEVGSSEWEVETSAALRLRAAALNQILEVASGDCGNRPRMGPRIHEWGGWRVGRPSTNGATNTRMGWVASGEWEVAIGKWKPLHLCTSAPLR
jgi:hypothetical protein